MTRKVLKVILSWHPPRSPTLIETRIHILWTFGLSMSVFKLGFICTNPPPTSLSGALSNYCGLRDYPCLSSLTPVLRIKLRFYPALRPLIDVVFQFKQYMYPAYIFFFIPTELLPVLGPLEWWHEAYTWRGPATNPYNLHIVNKLMNTSIGLWANKRCICVRHKK